MRTFVFILVGILSFSTSACFPCDYDASIYIFKEAKPKFTKGYFGVTDTGYVKFRIDDPIPMRKHVAKKISIIQLEPKDLPRDAIMNMLQRNSYSIAVKDKNLTACIDSYELEMKFNLPQKLEIESEIEISVPKLEINK